MRVHPTWKSKLKHVKPNCCLIQTLFFTINALTAVFNLCGEFNAPANKKKLNSNSIAIYSCTLNTWAKSKSVQSSDRPLLESSPLPTMDRVPPDQICHRSAGFPFSQITVISDAPIARLSIEFVFTVSMGPKITELLFSRSEKNLHNW